MTTPIEAASNRITSNRLRRVVVQLWVLLFVVAFGTTLSGVAAIRPIVQLVWIAPVIVLAIVSRPFLPTRLAMGLSACLIAYGVAALFSSVPWMSLETLGYATAVTALFVVAAGMSQATRVHMSRAVITGIAGWLAVLTVSWGRERLQWLIDAGWPPPIDPMQSFLWLVGNSIPVLVVLAIPFLGWLTSSGPDPWLRRGFWIAAVPAVVLSGGLIGIFGLVVAAAVYGLWRFLDVRRRLYVVGAMASLGVALLAGLVSRAIEVPSTAEARLLVWSQGVGMLASDPVTGAGPGMTALARLEHVEPHAVAVLTDHLHSIAVQAAAEGGLLLVAALLFAVGTWARTLWHERTALGDRERIAIACLVGFGLSAIGDSFLDVPLIPALAVTLAAWTVTPAESNVVSDAGGARGLRIVILVMVVASVVPVITADVARVHAQAGRAHASREEWSEALVRFEAARAWNSSNPLYTLEAGTAASETGDVDLAARRFAEAVRMAPQDGRTLGALAGVESSSDSQIPLLEEAARRANGDAQYAYRLGVALQSAGRRDEALDAFAEAVALRPNVIIGLPATSTSAITRGDVLRALPAVLEEIDQRARLDDDAIRWDLQLLQGELDGAAPSVWRAVDAAAHGDLVDAERLLNAAIAEAPTDARTWQAAIAIYGLQCDSHGIARAQRLERSLADSHRQQGAERIAHWERVYREPSLGDFQALAQVPADPIWPEPFIVVSPRCSPE